jgi:hypothetical protein
MDTATQDSPLQGVRVSLIPAGGLGVGEMPYASVGPDGAFVLRNVIPDKYRLTLSRVAARSWYVSYIGIGGKQSTDGTVELSGPNELDMAIGTDAGEITGSVKDGATDSPAEATVTLVPNDRREINPALYRQIASDPNGAFRFAGVAPGKYRILAWEDIDPRPPRDPEYYRLFDFKAVLLDIDQYGHSTVQLTIISAGDVAAILGFQ